MRVIFEIIDGFSLFSRLFTFSDSRNASLSIILRPIGFLDSSGTQILALSIDEEPEAISFRGLNFELRGPGWREQGLFMMEHL